jgi:hypothetical protein
MPFFTTITVEPNGGSCGAGAGFSNTSCLSPAEVLATGEEPVINTLSVKGNEYTYALDPSVLVCSLTIANCDGGGEGNSDFTLLNGTSHDLYCGGHITDNNVDINDTDLINTGITLNGPAAFTIAPTDQLANGLESNRCRAHGRVRKTARSAGSLSAAACECCR